MLIEYIKFSRHHGYTAWQNPWLIRCKYCYWTMSKLTPVLKVHMVIHAMATRGLLLTAKEPVPDFFQGKSGASDLPLECVPWFRVILGLEFNLAITSPVCYKGLLAVFCSLCLIASLLGTFYENNMVLERPVSRVVIKKHHNHWTQHNSANLKWDSFFLSSSFLESAGKFHGARRWLDHSKGEFDHQHKIE